MTKPDSKEEIALRLQETEDHLGAFVMFCRRNGFTEAEQKAESLYILANNMRVKPENKKEQG